MDEIEAPYRTLYYSVVCSKNLKRCPHRHRSRSAAEACQHECEEAAYLLSGNCGIYHILETHTLHIKNRRSRARAHEELKFRGGNSPEAVARRKRLGRPFRPHTPKLWLLGRFVDPAAFHDAVYHGHDANSHGNW